jgi:hypothetical protein
MAGFCYWLRELARPPNSAPRWWRRTDFSGRVRRCTCGIVIQQCACPLSGCRISLQNFSKWAPMTSRVSLPLTEVLRPCRHACDTPGKARYPMSASSASRRRREGLPQAGLMSGLGQGLSSSPSSGHLNSVSAVPPNSGHHSDGSEHLRFVPGPDKTQPYSITSSAPARHHPGLEKPQADASSLQLRGIQARKMSDK